MSEASGSRILPFGVPERDTATPDSDADRERAAVLDVILAETDAYLMKDYDAWASFWVQNSDAMRLQAFAGRGVWVDRGWTAVSSPVAETMERYPQTSPSAGRIARDDLRIVVGADMAWVDHDQLGPRPATRSQKARGRIRVRVERGQRLRSSRT